MDWKGCRFIEHVRLAGQRPTNSTVQASAAIGYTLVTSCVILSSVGSWCLRLRFCSAHFRFSEMGRLGDVRRVANSHLLLVWLPFASPILFVIPVELLGVGAAHIFQVFKFFHVRGIIYASWNVRALLGTILDADSANISSAPTMRDTVSR